MNICSTSTRLLSLTPQPKFLILPPLYSEYYSLTTFPRWTATASSKPALYLPQIPEVAVWLISLLPVCPLPTYPSSRPVKCIFYHILSLLKTKHTLYLVTSRISFQPVGLAHRVLHALAIAFCFPCSPMSSPGAACHTMPILCSPHTREDVLAYADASAWGVLPLHLLVPHLAISYQCLKIQLLIIIIYTKRALTLCR